MYYQFTINATLPNLNDYLRAERTRVTTKYGKTQTSGNVMKHDAQNLIIGFIRRDLRGLHIDKPIKIHYRIYEPNKKRDLDNILSFIMKCTQDSLVLAGVIDNDGWSNIVGISAEFFVDATKPRIEVYLIEKEGENNAGKNDQNKTGKRPS